MAYFMANFAGAFGFHTRLKRAQVQTHSKPHAGEKIPPIAYFMANSGMDLRFLLNCHPPA